MNDSVPTKHVVSRGERYRTFKIIVVGDSNVGKTCLAYRFCEGKFPDQVETTIGFDFRNKIVDVEGEQIKLHIWDTAGQERFRSAMVGHYYRDVSAVVYVYDVTKLASFQNLPSWIEECDRLCERTDIPRIIVGNKCDSPEPQAVSTQDAQVLADQYNMPLFETSALLDSQFDNVEAIFLTLAYKVKSEKPLMPANRLTDRVTLANANQSSSCWCF